ncbi:ABC transporter permease [Alkalicoccus saliphilus]|uniref:ABC transporter permease n=1 Tax=Alkalicoccus saliphilus TaxID=200989 RepID=A0A2T4U300_9BACI|nr:ABC transporter permease [Alkalicoccus saliphilus]PTL37725.1 ABC transporter permease [Alkalicoccus saliphilus]
MKQFWVMYKKEWLEAFRNWKILWVPIVFMILGASQPLTVYYMDTILQTVGGLPEGTVFDIPLPEAEEILPAVQSQFNQIGLLILVLAFMGSTAGERQHGTHLMILSKPVSEANFILSKAAQAYSLSFMAYAGGIAAAVYYTVILFGSLEPVHVLKGASIYAVWLAFVISLLFFFSSFIKGYGGAAFLTLITALLVSLSASFLPERLIYSPGTLSAQSSSLYLTGSSSAGFLGALFFTLFLTAGLLTAACILFKKKKLA